MADILKKTPSNKLLPIIKNPKYYEDFKNNERAAGQRKDNAWREKVVKDSEWTDIMDDLRMTPAQRKKLLPPIEKRQSELQKEINKWDAEIKKNQKSAANNFLNRKTPQGKKWASEHKAEQVVKNIQNDARRAMQSLKKSIKNHKVKGR